MVDSSLQEQLKNLLDSAQTLLVIFPTNATSDQLAVASSLYLSLQQTQKNVRLVSPQPFTDQDSVFAGLSDTQTELGHQNLCISFAYTPEQVDKVSYHIGQETGKFYLTIKPKAGFQPLDSENVEFSYTGTSADVLILVGVQDLENLNQLYFGYENVYRDVPIISINNFATSFGTVKVDTGSQSCMSEVVAQLITALGLTLTGDVATNLLYAIDEATNQLSSYSATAETFEVVAQLMRAGARRIMRSKSAHSNINEDTILSLKEQDFPTDNLLEPTHEPEEDTERSLTEESPKPKTKKTNGSKSTTNKKAVAMPPTEFTPVRRL